MCRHFRSLGSFGFTFLVLVVVLIVSALTARAEGVTDEQIAQAIKAFQADVQKLPQDNKSALQQGSVKAAKDALHGLNVLDMSADQISRLGNAGVLPWAEAAGWDLTPEQARRVNEAQGANVVQMMWPDNQTVVSRVRLYELIRDPGPEGARAAVAMLNLIAYPSPETPSSQANLMVNAEARWLRTALEHPGLHDALRAGQCSELLEYYGARTRFAPRVIASLTTSFQSLERVLTSDLPPSVVVRLLPTLNVLLRAPDADWQTRERIRQKIMMLVKSAGLKATPDDAPTKAALNQFEQSLVAFDRQIAQWEEGSRDPGLKGAQAALARLAFLPVPGPDTTPARLVEMRQIQRAALKVALEHPALGEALKLGDIRIFQALHLFDPAIVTALMPSVLALEQVITPDLPPSLGANMEPLLDALVKNAGSDAQAREQLRTKIVAFAQAAKPRAGDDTVKRSLSDLERYASSATARGQLIGFPAPPFAFGWSSYEELPWLGLDFQPSSMSQFNGHVVMLDFWTSASKPAVHSLAWLHAMEKRYEGCPVVILGVASHQDVFTTEDGIPVEVKDKSEKEYDLMRKFVQKTRVAVPVVLTPDPVLDDYGIRSIPNLVIIDPKGIVRYCKPFKGEPIPSVDKPGMGKPDTDQPDVENPETREVAATIDGLLKEFGLTLPGTPGTKTAAQDARIEWALKSYTMAMANLAHTRKDQSVRAAARQREALPNLMLTKSELKVEDLSPRQIAHLMDYGLLKRSFLYEPAQQRLKQLATDKGMTGAEAACALLLTLTSRPSGTGTGSFLGEQQPSPPGAGEITVIAQAVHHPGLPEALRQGQAGQIFLFMSRVHPQTIRGAWKEIAELSTVLPDDTAPIHVPLFRSFYENLGQKHEPLRVKLLSIARAAQASLAVALAAHTAKPSSPSIQEQLVRDIAETVKYLESASAVIP
jgi:hypothetical protein